jgi:hypothetical protein
VNASLRSYSYGIRPDGGLSWSGINMATNFNPHTPACDKCGTDLRPSSWSVQAFRGLHKEVAKTSLYN